MTFGRVAEALPRAIRLVGWPKLVIFFFFYTFRLQDSQDFIPRASRLNTTTMLNMTDQTHKRLLNMRVHTIVFVRKY